MTPTPAMTHHARERCAEMGLSTKVAKQIVRHAEVRRPAGQDGVVVATSERHPDYAVIYAPTGYDDRPVVLTVVFRIEADYIRQGETYVIAS